MHTNLFAIMKVLCWNILAPIFVRTSSPHTAFAYCSDDEIDFEARKKRILSILRDQSPDVICLQEVQMEPTQDADAPFQVPEFLRDLGYENFVPFGKTQTPKEWMETLEHNSKSLGRKFVTHLATLVRPSTMEKVHAVCTSHSLLLQLRDRRDGRVWVVGNAHLQARFVVAALLFSFIWLTCRRSVVQPWCVVRTAREATIQRCKGCRKDSVWEHGALWRF
jgi:mRNA deadenylase 3'-5' endonuclease subunit Ccr4